MHAFPRSPLLVLETSSAVSSLIPSTLVDQVDALLDAHRIDDAALLVDQRRKKLEANLTVDPDEAEELDYAYQVIGFKCFSATLFDDAGRNLFNGHLDPRILVSYYPDLRGDLFSGVDVENQVDVFAGVAERMPQAKDIDELIKLNLVLNYSPHLSPESPPSVELTRVLKTAAMDMLCLFLEKSRKRIKVEGGNRGNISCVVDTVLAKLYATSSAATAQLTQLISEPDTHISLQELEPLLLSHTLYPPLISLYKLRKQTEKILELYASLPPGVVEDPVGGIYDLLTGPTMTSVTIGTGQASKKREENIKWGLWMLQKGEIDKGLRLLIPPETTSTQSQSKRKPKLNTKEKEKELELLNRISEVDQSAGNRYLEYLVLRRGFCDEQLHTKLAIGCIDEIGRWLQDESVCKLWRAKVASYSSRTIRPSASTSASSPSCSSPNPSTPTPQTPPTSSSSSSYPNLQQQQQQQPFLTYFSSTTPDSSSKLARLKAIFMLAGSTMYDVRVVLDRSLELCSSSSGERSDKDREMIQQILALELVILYGKLGNHATALETLVYTLRDTTSAEMYCNLGGEVVPTRMAHSIASSSSFRGLGGVGEVGLMEWYKGLFETPLSTATTTTNGGVTQASIPAVVRQKSVKEDVKRGLLTDLVGVYVRDATNGMDCTKALLERQGVNLDVVDVITLVPDDWTLNSLHTFLARYFRRTVHSSYENIILKNLSAGQNLAIRERSWPILRSHGYVIEEADSDVDDGDGDEKMTQRLLQTEQQTVHEKVAGTTDTLEKGFIHTPERVDIRIVEEENMKVLVPEERSALGLILDGGGEVEEDRDGIVNVEVEPLGVVEDVS